MRELSEEETDEGANDGVGQRVGVEFGAVGAVRWGELPRSESGKGE